MLNEVSGGAAQEYWLDAWQRSVLFLDILRERGNVYLERSKQDVQHVLSFPTELIRDGRTLARPVNYELVRIIPPAGTQIDPALAPIIVVDPRAGHGPGIAGMKPESQIGVVLKAGRACYFVGFLPEPMPGQTIEDVCQAEAIFVEDVAARHPEAEGKPVIIGNCQAGWQIMMMAAVNSNRTGPIMLAGSPLSYWAGVRGKNPMRYLGGMLGGTWLTSLAGDMGHGIFDGANLVANFEYLNPANTYWTKPYNVYSKVDTERERFLGFEIWWGNPVLLNAEEMQWIADNLFVGNRLASGQIRTSDGIRIDLRNIKTPIIVFCSWGDDITPPQQALGWLLDLYDHEREIALNGQTIIYTMHESIGHLGIFVSGQVATKEHAKFASGMDIIEMLPPGLFEAVITEIGEDTRNTELVCGRYRLHFEGRTLDHIRALGGNDIADNMRFTTVARVSEINRGLYLALAAPAMRMAATEQTAELLRQTHPNRLRFAMFSDRNPLMRQVKAMADSVRQTRRPVRANNPWLAIERMMSDGISSYLRASSELRDTMVEAAFLSIYGSPLLQTMVGLGTPQAEPQKIERDLVREAGTARLRSDLERRFELGGAEEAAMRALSYIGFGMGLYIDERSYSAYKLFRAALPADQRLSLERQNEMAREQHLLVCLDEERAIAALPKLLASVADWKREEAIGIVRRFLSVSGDGKLPDEARRRLERVEALWGMRPEKENEITLARAAI
jgi:hypothetical protein